MTSCIFTVIKDEQNYLEEWINYHLQLGVDHIFIFEDIDSSSHGEITNKYASQVSLANISTILNAIDLKIVNEYKVTKFRSPQRTYVYRGLLYIKNNFNYDWCFIIDNDEFITLENEESTLSEVLSSYDGYDAVVMSWKCYGANGLVNMPDYSKKGVLDTYTESIKGYVPIIKKKYDKKTVYNLRTYNISFFNDTHVPSENCNYCNTVFEKDVDNIAYSNIYIRHYITKSWEEYLWKKRSRGYFMGLARSFNAFFKINPDMCDKQEELLSKIDEEVLVVLPYSRRGSQGNELRIALKGWKKFCKSKYHFVLIGDYSLELENEFPWVEFIYEPSIPRKENQYTPHLDIQHKMERIYDLFKERYSGFIWMVDDNYAIKPFYTYEIKAIHFHSDNFTGEETAPVSFWKHDKWKTKQLLVREGLKTINYTTHFPCYFEFSRLKEIWDKYNLREESYVVEDIYFNNYPHIKPSLDSKIRLGVWNKRIYEEEFEKALLDQHIKFVCNSVEGWSKELENSLEKIVEGD